MADIPGITSDSDPALANRFHYSSDLKRGLLLRIILMWLLTGHKQAKLEEFFTLPGILSKWWRATNLSLPLARRSELQR